MPVVDLYCVPLRTKDKLPLERVITIRISIRITVRSFNGAIDKVYSIVNQGSILSRCGCIYIFSKRESKINKFSWNYKIYSKHSRMYSRHSRIRRITYAQKVVNFLSIVDHTRTLARETLSSSSRAIIAPVKSYHLPSHSKKIL